MWIAGSPCYLGVGGGCGFNEPQMSPLLILRREAMDAGAGAEVRYEISLFPWQWP